ncbi:MAG TPA: hypothetical protein VD994_17050 [Prosthecobacter sp.]|nr:hypothetical protein [Prosthecobacter sp.]
MKSLIVPALAGNGGRNLVEVTAGLVEDAHLIRCLCDMIGCRKGNEKQLLGNIAIAIERAVLAISETNGVQIKLASRRMQ